MKLIIDIPNEFEEHFNNDKFKDSLCRITQDVISSVYFEDSISGNYEIELLEILTSAFEKAESFHSSCIFEDKPIYYDAPAQEVKWIYLHDDKNEDGDIIRIGECTNCYKSCECTHYCPNCGAKLRWKD